MHGGFGRDNTFNNMAARGPDFKASFEDPIPVSNADVAPTVAHILGFALAAKGRAAPGTGAVAAGASATAGFLFGSGLRKSNLKLGQVNQTGQTTKQHN